MSDEDTAPTTPTPERKPFSWKRLIPTLAIMGVPVLIGIGFASSPMAHYRTYQTNTDQFHHLVPPADAAYAKQNWPGVIQHWSGILPNIPAGESAPIALHDIQLRGTAQVAVSHLHLEDIEKGRSVFDDLVVMLQRTTKPWSQATVDSVGHLSEAFLDKLQHKEATELQVHMVGSLKRFNDMEMYAANSWSVYSEELKRLTVMLLHMRQYERASQTAAIGVDVLENKLGKFNQRSMFLQRMVGKASLQMGEVEDTFVILDALLKGCVDTHGRTDDGCMEAAYGLARVRFIQGQTESVEEAEALMLKIKDVLDERGQNVKLVKNETDLRLLDGEAELYGGGWEVKAADEIPDV